MPSVIKMEKKTLLGDIWVEMPVFRKNLAADNETGCINWTGARHRQGYGFVHIVEDSTLKPKQTTAHRVAYRIANPNDPITSKDMIVHTCGNMSCCNPKHLVKGDRKTINSYRHTWKNPGKKSGADAIKQNRDYEYTVAEYRWMIGKSILEIQQRFGVTRKRAFYLRRLTQPGSRYAYPWLKHFDDTGALRDEYKHLYE